jgi:sugar lactone lactonase YvrE
MVTIRIALLASFSVAAHAAFLFANVEGSAQLNQYSTSGTLLHTASISFPSAIAANPSGNVFVSNGANFSIEEFNGQTDAFITTFESGIVNPIGLTFGPDGNLYAAEFEAGETMVVEYNGTTGAFMSTFVTLGEGGLGEGDDLEFGPNGNLFVADNTNSEVLEYNGTTGAFVGTFVAQGSGGMSNPVNLMFQSNGDLLLAADSDNAVYQYDSSGNFVKIFAQTGEAFGLTSDAAGNVYVSTGGFGTIREYNSSGAFVGTFASGLNDVLDIMEVSTPEPSTGAQIGLALLTILLAWKRLPRRRSSDL